MGHMHWQEPNLTHIRRNVGTQNLGKQDFRGRRRTPDVAQRLHLAVTFNGCPDLLGALFTPVRKVNTCTGPVRAESSTKGA